MPGRGPARGHPPSPRMRTSSHGYTTLPPRALRVREVTEYVSGLAWASPCPIYLRCACASPCSLIYVTVRRLGAGLALASCGKPSKPGAQEWVMKGRRLRQARLAYTQAWLAYIRRAKIHIPSLMNRQIWRSRRVPYS